MSHRHWGHLLSLSVHLVHHLETRAWPGFEVVLKNRKERNKSHFYDSDFGKPCSFLFVFPVLTERSLGEQVQTWKSGCLLCSEALLPVSHKGFHEQFCLCIGFFLN